MTKPFWDHEIYYYVQDLINTFYHEEYERCGVNTFISKERDGNTRFIVNYDKDVGMWIVSYEDTDLHMSNESYEGHFCQSFPLKLDIETDETSFIYALNYIQLEYARLADRLRNKSLRIMFNIEHLTRNRQNERSK